MASISVSFYIFGCPGCGVVLAVTTKHPPLCVDPHCPRVEEPLFSWRELMDRLAGESWKYGG